MKHTATFPADAGQCAGTHSFTTKTQLERFLSRMQKRGIDTSKAVIFPPPKAKKAGQ